MTSPSPGSTAVLFDIDGTLVDSTYHHAWAWHRAFARHDLVLPLWRVHRAVGMGGDKLVSEVVGEDVEQRLGDALRDAWKEEYAAVLDTVHPLPGAADLVRAVARAGHQVALASSGEEQFSKAAIERLGIGDLVDVATSSGDVEESKPEPDLLGVTLERLGEDRPVGRAALVGDTPYDVAAADRIGLPCIAVLTGGFSRAELEQAGAALIAESPAELVDLDWSQHLGRVRPGEAS